MKFQITLLMVFSFLQVQCTHKKVSEENVNICVSIKQQIKDKDPIDQLKNVTNLFQNKCYQDVLTAGLNVQKNYDKNKFMAFIFDASEVILPHGSVTDYSLEPYERTYLSILLTLSHFHLGN